MSSFRLQFRSKQAAYVSDMLVRDRSREEQKFDKSQKLKIRSIQAADFARMSLVERKMNDHVDYFVKTASKIKGFDWVSPREQIETETHQLQAKLFSKKSKRVKKHENDPRLFTHMTQDEQQIAVRKLIQQNHKMYKDQDFITKFSRLQKLNAFDNFYVKENIMKRATQVLGKNSAKEISSDPKKPKVTVDSRDLGKHTSTQSSDRVTLPRFQHSNKAFKDDITSGRRDSKRLIVSTSGRSLQPLWGEMSKSSRNVLSPRETSHTSLHQATVRSLMSNSDVYFKSYIEERAPQEYKPQMLDLQNKIEIFNNLTKCNNKIHLHKAKGISQQFKLTKLRAMKSSADLDSIETGFKRFQALLRRYPDHDEAAPFQDRDTLKRQTSIDRL